MKSSDKKPIVLFDIDYTLFNVDLFKESKFTEFTLYDEVKEALNILGEIATLGILSEGELHLQRKKIEKTGIGKYFNNENIHIVSNKPENLRKILKEYVDESLFLVEDKLTILHVAKKMFPSIFTIWLRRGKYANEHREILGLQSDVAVDNLLEVASVVKKALKIEN